MAVDCTLKLLKLPMLWHKWEDLCLDRPLKPMYKKGPCLALFKDITSNINVLAESNYIAAFPINLAWKRDGTWKRKTEG